MREREKEGEREREIIKRGWDEERAERVRGEREIKRGLIRERERQREREREMRPPTPHPS